jgi:hypothetical protein
MEQRKEKLNIGYEEKEKDISKFNIPEIFLDLIKAKKQCRLEIMGIEIYFPYTPYQVQLDYMAKG